MVTQRSEPFVIYQNGKYIGFSIELWEKIAKTLGLKYEIYSVNTIAKLLYEVKRGAADAAVSSIGITSRHEKYLDFSHAYFESGLQIMVREGADSFLEKILQKSFAVLLSSELIYGVSFFFVCTHSAEKWPQ
ncbi:MAG: transporter substrate-binding domain-containing protein [Desulfobacteraceae bacterium]